MLERLATSVPLLGCTLVGLALHEAGHAWAAHLLGDPTPRHAGRLTLNPLRHLEPLGALGLPFAVLLLSGGSSFVAFARPVTFVPGHLRWPRGGTILVALAGPTVNAILGVAAALCAGTVASVEPIAYAFRALSFVNLMLALLNLLPVPPLDGSYLWRAFVKIPTLLPERGWIPAIAPYAAVVSVVALVGLAAYGIGEAAGRIMWAIIGS